MSRLHVFIALAFVVPFQSQADVGTPTAEQVPSNTQSKTANLPTVDVETWVLDNGLTVLLSRDTRLPVVAVEVRYMVGSAHEKVGRSGFAHLFEHLMSRILAWLLPIPLQLGRRLRQKQKEFLKLDTRQHLQGLVVPNFP